MNVDSPPPKGDILSPLTSLEWRECSRPPKGGAQAVCLEDKVYFGSDKLYVYSPTTDTWAIKNTPVHSFALVVYHSQLVLVGGWMTDDGSVTNKLWTLDRQDQWKETLPPMTVRRQEASAVEYSNNILVAGGWSDQGTDIDIVEVYNGHHWAKAQSLPIVCSGVNSAILNGHWYLARGDGQGKQVYYASVESLIASCQPSGRQLPSVWKRLPDVPHEYFIPVAFGNRLVAIGYDTSSIHAYSPYSISWVHVGELPGGGSASAAIVLPSGDLIVTGYGTLYKGRLNATPFDPDSRFTMVALRELEGFGVINLNNLERYAKQLNDVVGIEGTDRTYFNLSFLLVRWIQGHASLDPTWRHLFWALRETKLSHFANQVESCLNGVVAEQGTSSNLDPNPDRERSERGGEEDTGRSDQGFEISEEEKHIAAVQKAMEERGMLDHTIVHGVFVGPARSGKNSIMERLLGRMPSTVSPSTGVAESVVHVKIIQKSTTFAANVKESIWSPMDSDEEAIKLSVINTDSQVKKVDEIQGCDTNIDPKDLHPVNDKVDNMTSELETDNKLCLSESVTVSSDTKLKSGAQGWSNADVPMEVSPSKSVTSGHSRGRLPNSYISPSQLLKMALRNKGKEDFEKLQRHFHKTWSLYLTNTGGQMEFQEVLPLLVSGPSIFFYVFRLDRDINMRYMIEYDCEDGTKAEPYKSSLTTLEGLLQTLATIAAMGTFVYKDLQRREVPLRPKVFIVGTHMDQLPKKTASSQILNIDHQFQEAIKSTAHYKDLVEFASPSQLIFTVNNFSEKESDFQDMRTAVERVVERDAFKMTSPAHWLIFSLVLRQIKSDVITYNECREIAKQCGLADEELDDALRFIHSKMGLIRYFPYEEIKHLVVLRPQFLFDKVTEMIISTFTFDKMGKQAIEDFKKKGIFSLEQFEAISSRTNTSMKPFEFAKLLESLRIAAPFRMEGKIMYFFPSVLAHTEEVPPIHQLTLACTTVPNAMITFKCGYCPKGLAGALVKYLMANEMQSESFLWRLNHETIFRNQVSFEVGPLDTIVLKISSTHLEIICIANAKFKNRKACTFHRLCSEIFKAMDSGIKQVTSDIDYVNAEHSFTFSCECKEVSTAHPGELEYFDGEPFCLTCSKTGEKHALPAYHDYWNTMLRHRGQSPLEGDALLPETFSIRSEQVAVGSEVSDQFYSLSGGNATYVQRPTPPYRPTYSQVPTSLPQAGLSSVPSFVYGYHPPPHVASTPVLWPQTGDIIPPLQANQGQSPFLQRSSSLSLPQTSSIKFEQVAISSQMPAQHYLPSPIGATYVMPHRPVYSQAAATPGLLPQSGLSSFTYGHQPTHLTPSTSSWPQSADKFSDVDSTTILGERDLNLVLKEVSPIKPRYFQLGRELGIPIHEVETLHKQYGAVNYDQALNDMILLWLRGRTSRTWQALVRAVDSETGGNNHPLALEIASRHKAVGAYMP